MAEQLTMLTNLNSGDPAMGARYEHTSGARVIAGFVTDRTVVLYPVNKKGPRCRLSWQVDEFLQQFVRVE